MALNVMHNSQICASGTHPVTPPVKIGLTGRHILRVEVNVLVRIPVLTRPITCQWHTNMMHHPASHHQLTEPTGNTPGP
jgi:hypothetical protein